MSSADAATMKALLDGDASKRRIAGNKKAPSRVLAA
jgi:hypothetical protein